MTLSVGAGFAGAGSNDAGRWLEFDIHGTATMRVAAEAPTAAQLEQMFAPFLGPVADGADVVVTADHEDLGPPAWGEHDYAYTPTSVTLTRSGVQVVVEGGRYRVHGRRELLTTVLPLVDSILVRRGMAMIHAATFAYEGRGVALPAWGGTGKTSTIARLRRVEGAAFMGDDWAFLTADGRLLGYAKPMFIKPHHRELYPHLFAERRKPLVPPTLSRPVARLTTLVHPLATRFPRVAGWSRRWSPEYLMVTPAEALAGTPVATSAPLAAAVFVERADRERVVLEERDRDWMVARLIGNFHAEITRHSQEVMTALGATGLVPLQETFREKEAVLARALAGVPAFLLQVPRAYPPGTAADAIVGRVLDLIGGARP